MPIAIKVDEDLPGAVKSLLRDAGHDVLTVADQGWSGRTDDQIWTGIRKEQRLLITADKGVADARKLSSTSHPGVVLLRLDRESWQGYTLLTEKLLSTTNLEQLRSAVTVVTLQGIRIRRKP